MKKDTPTKNTPTPSTTDADAGNNAASIQSNDQVPQKPVNSHWLL